MEEWERGWERGVKDEGSGKKISLLSFSHIRVIGGTKSS